MNSFVVTNNNKKMGSYKDLSEAHRAVVVALGEQTSIKVDSYIDLDKYEGTGDQLTTLNAAMVEVSDGTTFKIEVK